MEPVSKSSFVSEIEHRLNILFGEDEKGPEGEKKTIIHDALEEVSAKPSEPVKGPLDDRMESSVDSKPDKPVVSSFVQEIEQRLNVLFGDESKTVRLETVPEEHESLKEIVPETVIPTETAGKEERFDQLFGDIASSTSILYSPLKDLKSIVLSIEWEISEPVLEKFDDEVSRLNDVYASDRTIIGFLRILRFLGRYIRVKGADADAASVRMLLEVYDNLESVLLSADMGKKVKSARLLENIKKYKEWVANIELAPVEIEGKAEEVPPQVMLDTPPPQAMMETAPPQNEVEVNVPSWSEEGEGEYVIAEPPILARKEPFLETAIPLGEDTKEVTSIVEIAASVPQEEGKKEALHPAVTTVSGEMTPHEAFALALEEIKKMIQAELSALRAELKMWRQGQ